MNPLDINGLLLINKPSGMTSHDVVYKIRKHFKFKKVGHGGTLDPMATGLLVILIGKGTKLSDWVMQGDKGYSGNITFGHETSTQDAEGEITTTANTDHLTEEAITEAAKSFLGDIEQIPPMVSAIKKDGVPLYKLARAGKSIERPPRKVRIDRFDIRDVNLPVIDFDIDCTKGTYVRTISEDLGRKVDSAAHLSALSRTKSGNFELSRAHELDEILALDTASVAEHVISLEELASENS